jgi:uncharacterized coiled-coil protein SlyX
MNRSPLRAFLLIPFVLGCFALSPQARAVCQEGCLTSQNTVLGDDALLNNTGSANTAIGADALYSNTTGNFNTATGIDALLSNTTGINNTANGNGALVSNTTANNNTANGVAALAQNTTGSFNTANGVGALEFNTTGGNNTANGFQALYSNITGGRNTANGVSALNHNTTGFNNIALGFSAGDNLTIGNNNIDIGNKGVAGEANTIRIGKVGTQQATFIAGISGVTVAGGVGVIIDSNGHLGTVVSSERFKDEIKPMDKASEAILALKPVTFCYKPELDPNGIPQFGLVAEEVEKVNPDLVARDADGKAYTVRYEAVNAMLLNEFLKEHRAMQEQNRKIQEQEATITELKATVAQQQKDFQAVAARQQEQIEALTAGLQRVSAQVEMSRPASQMVVNDQ